MAYSHQCHVKLRTADSFTGWRQAASFRVASAGDVSAIKLM